MVLGGYKMKQLIVLIGAILVGSYSFAGIHSEMYKKSSSQLVSMLNKTLRAPRQTSLHVAPDKDIHIVYGGADIARRLPIVPYTVSG